MEHTRILGIYAHPDDADVGAGGTLAHFARQGADIQIVVVTSGDAGGFEADRQHLMSEVRQQEQRDALECLGIQKVTFLEGHRDGCVKDSGGLIQELVAEIRRQRPSLILTMSPQYNWENLAANHPDHRAVGAATVDAVYPAARNPFAFPELLEQGLEPHRVKEVWFQGHRENNLIVPLEKSDVEAKLCAVRCHESQFEDMSRVERFIQSRMLEAAEAGPDGTEAAEAFFRWVTD